MKFYFSIDGQWLIMNFCFIHQGGSHTQRKFSAHHARRILYRLFDVRHYCDRIRLSPGRFIERSIITRSIQFPYWRKPWKLDQWKDTGIWRIISVSELNFWREKLKWTRSSKRIIILMKKYCFLLIKCKWQAIDTVRKFRNNQK
jgi:transposase